MEKIRVEEFINGLHNTINTCYKVIRRVSGGKDFTDLEEEIKILAAKHELEEEMRD